AFASLRQRIQPAEPVPTRAALTHFAPDTATGKDDLAADVRRKLQTAHLSPSQVKSQVQRDRRRRQNEAFNALRQELRRFRQWLSNVGFTDLPQIPKLEPDPFGQPSASYAGGTIYVPKAGIDDHDALPQLYMFHLLSVLWGFDLPAGEVDIL